MIAIDKTPELPHADPALAATNCTDVPVRTMQAELARLNALDLNGLRQRWRKLLRAPAPDHLPRWLLLRILAYRTQAAALGDLDRETVRFLRQVARERERRHAADGPTSGKKPPPVPPVPDKGTLKPGTILVREHDKVMHHVMVVQEGFAWNGTRYRSLSEVAFAITGTNWNGPRFFGLRTKGTPDGRLAVEREAVS